MPFRDLDAYIKQARRANSDRELFSCSEAAARQLGLPWLAIVQSMAFFQPGGRYFRMDNFQSWGDVFVAEGYYRDDPALLAARSTSRAFCWHEMERLLGGFTRRQARIVREAAQDWGCLAVMMWPVVLPAVSLAAGFSNSSRLDIISTNPGGLHSQPLRPRLAAQPPILAGRFQLALVFGKALAEQVGNAVLDLPAGIFEGRGRPVRRTRQRPDQGNGAGPGDAQALGHDAREEGDEGFTLALFWES